MLTRAFILVLVAAYVAADTPTLYEETERVALKITERMKGHVKNIRPPGETTNVTVNMYVRNIFKMDPIHNRWLVQLTLRQEWLDTRLMYTPKNDKMKMLAYGNSRDIWIPDLFFREEIETKMNGMNRLMDPDELIHIYPDGRCLLSRRVTVELFCPVDFKQKNFVCPMGFASYMHTKDELELIWKHDNPVQLNPNMRMMDFNLNGVTTQRCDSKTIIGKWSCITALFNFGHDVCKA